ncbi:MAG TPA: Fe-S protein assembly co-chaperone HscB [Haliangiales bacterium]|nr:Fe-S protein assembly co-chaperone HscB [Haliangiales bacterium]
MNKFEVLGFEPRFGLDAVELERRYKELSKKLHPDRFATAPAKERIASLAAATALNDAYRTLRAPVARAAHLLEIHGRKLGQNESVDQAFLMEILELREALAEAQAEGDAPRIQALGGDIGGRRAAALTALGEALDAERWDDAKRELVLLRYFDRFLAAHGDEEEDE